MTPSKNTIISIIITLLIKVTGYSQIQELSINEKIADFNYLFTELGNTYPYFGVNKRNHGIDWLAKRSEFLDKIKQTKNDEEFIRVLEDILNQLNNGHTDLLPTTYYKYFYDGYKNMLVHRPQLKAYVTELEKTTFDQVEYWTQLLESAKSESSNAESNESHSLVSDENLSYSYNDSLSIAFIKVRSFSYDLIENDMDNLKSCFSKAHNYKNLIIDIQGNTGGDTRYWSDHMIPYLIKDTINYSIIYGFKNSKRLKSFKPSYFENTISIDQFSLPNLPQELKHDNYFMKKDFVEISPEKTAKQYNGKIYLLVDEVVYSSSESLAYFFKATKFGKVVGKITGGDGVGTDPLLLTLPNSGIVVRYISEMGLNPDGSSNEEVKTIPDIVLKSETEKGRYEELVNYIKSLH
ncbi:MAG: hypothetical protein HRU50_08945 [Winogradskyella sp.]|uniref:S41 family peptidase n=1 Tax=Winogradskyella sp. TaxID=1883156 RepID=UPI0026010233|nr:S41 family peptidase [Winogradskyella sp.]NRB60044.1 hypothetical protein [Winogradskyella sp.]